jgi:hypothetical protein
VTTREEENIRKSFVAMRAVVQAPKLCSSINQTATGQFALAASACIRTARLQRTWIIRDRDADLQSVGTAKKDWLAFATVSGLP